MNTQKLGKAKAKEKLEVDIKHNDIKEMILVILMPSLALLMFVLSAVYFSNYLLATALLFSVLIVFVYLLTPVLDEKQRQIKHLDELKLQIGHLHFSHCSQASPLVMTDEKSHTEYRAEGLSNGWVGSGFYTVEVLDYKRVMCTECGSINIWKQDLPPELEN